MVRVDGDPGTDEHLLSELGHVVRRVGKELHATASIRPQMHVPGAANLRTSILAIWTDILTGLLVAEAVAPSVPVTLELDVHLYRPAPGSGLVRATARKIKMGRSVFVAGAEFTSEDDEPIALAAASFVSSPDPTVTFSSRPSIELPPSERLLSIPFAERANCERREPGVAVLARSEDGLNSSKTVNGGLIALAAEDAALSLESGATLCSLGIRYLQPVRVGPVVAKARQHQGLGLVELRDASNDDRLAGMATTRIFAGKEQTL